MTTYKDRYGGPEALAGRRILAVHPSPDLYGSDRVLLDGLHAFRGAGAAVETVVPRAGRLTETLFEHGFAWVEEEFPVLRKSLLHPIALVTGAACAAPAISRLRRFLRARRPDVVYVNTITLPHWIVAAKLERIPSVCHVHELESQLPRVIARGLLAPLALASGVLVNSKATARFVAQHAPATGLRCSVLYNGFRFTTLGPGSAFGRTARLTVVGRLSPRKGHDVALAALSQLVSRGENVRLEIVGDAYEGYEKYEEWLRCLAAQPAIEGRVRFAGFRSDPTDSYRAADLVVVPSRLEPFGNVAVEALGVGRAVIASDVGGLREIVDHGVTGLLVAPDDPAALADAISAMLADPMLARRMGTCGAESVRRRFSHERFGQELCRYVGVAAGSRG